MTPQGGAYCFLFICTLCMLCGDAQASTCSVSEVTLSGPTGSLTSPNYPNNYPNNLNCSWTIEAPLGHQLTITIYAFTTESGYDFLYIKDENNNEFEKLNGELAHIPYVIEIPHYRTFIRFTSDGSETRPGFRLRWSASSCLGIPLTNSSGTITSPGYPNDYYNNINCSWNIAVSLNKEITVNVDHFRTASEGDALMIYNPSNELAKSLYGEFLELPYRLRVPSNVARIHFVTDSSNVSSGFNLGWQATPPCSGIKFTTFSGSLTSPHYPSDYENGLNCDWTIEVPFGYGIAITVNTFNTSEDEDHLSVKDVAHGVVAKYVSSSSNPPFTVNVRSNVAHLEFVSDHSNTSKGFSLNWQATCSGVLLRQLSANITSPSYPNNYEKSLNCSWTLKVPSGYHFVILIERFETEPYYDYLKIYNHNNDLVEELHGSISSLPHRIRVADNEVHLVFSTDENIAQAGFRLRYQAKKGPLQITPTTDKDSITNIESSEDGHKTESWMKGVIVASVIVILVVIIGIIIVCWRVRSLLSRIKLQENRNQHEMNPRPQNVRARRLSNAYAEDQLVEGDRAACRVSQIQEDPTYEEPMLRAEMTQNIQ